MRRRSNSPECCRGRSAPSHLGLGAEHRQGRNGNCPVEPAARGATLSDRMYSGETTRPAAHAGLGAAPLRKCRSRLRGQRRISDSSTTRRCTHPEWIEGLPFPRWPEQSVMGFVLSGVGHEQAHLVDVR